MNTPRQYGFTLAELLIALAILGELAVFTIPKVLHAQADQRLNAVGKEVAGMISGAYTSYRLEHGISANTGAADLTAYMNYVRVDTTATIDDEQGGGSITCGDGGTSKCLVLHNGAIMFFRTTGHSFGGTSSKNVIYFHVDPDGVYSGTLNGSGKSALFFLTYPGRLTTWAGIESGTTSSDENWGGPDPAQVPPWLQW